MPDQVVTISKSYSDVQVRAETLDADDRTVEIIWAAGAQVKRYSWDEGYYLEELSMDPAAIRLDRFVAGMSLLDSHGSYSMESRLGTVVPGSIRIEGGKAYARIKLSRKARAEDLFQDLRDGHSFPVSVGYKVHAFEKREGNSNSLPILRAIDWEPMELSAVPVPADAGAHSRADPETYEVQIRSQSMPIPNSRARVTAPATDPIDEPIDENVRIFGPAEKKRLVERMGLDQTFYQRNARKDEAAFRAAVLDRLADDSDEDGQTSGMSVGSDHNNDPSIIRERRIEAYAARLGGPAPSDAARQYMGDKLIDHAAWSIEASGGRARNLAPDQIFGRSAAAHGTSDFPLFLTGVGDRMMMQAYALAQSPLKAVLARETKLPDFRPRMRLKLSDIGLLEKLGESAEIKSTTRSEAQESTALETFAKGFNLSRKAKINDDMQAFADWANAAGRASAETENRLLFDMLTQSAGAGPLMGEDGKRLFHADHGNLAAAGTALDETNLSAARLAMRKVKGLDGKTPVNVAPAYLMVGPELETAAEKLLAQIYAATSAAANPFSGRLELLVEGLIGDKSWFVFARPAAMPVLEYAHLESAPGPQTATEEDFDTAATKFRVLLDFGCSAVDWRGAYRNAGL